VTQLAPDEHEIEFGIKLNAEAGVVVAKSAVEGHFSVKLLWRRGDSQPS
jgi:Trypsin-co-occurring domain 1